MKKLYSLLFALIIFTLSQNIYAQKDSAAKATDSVNAVTLEAYNIKLAQIEQQRLKDSVKKSELEQQLQSLKTTDNLKKEELQKELEELENREATRLAAKREQIDKLRSKIKGSPVRGFFNDTLFNIYSKLGSFSAAERAQAITRRIEELGDNILFETDSLKTSNNETTADLVYHDRIIVSVSENDAI